MKRGLRTVLRVAVAFAAIAVAVAPSSATTLMRMGLESLVAGNATIVVGRVVDVHSYWNAQGTFVLSDVTVVASDVLKGQVGKRELTFTVMGGQVGDLATVIVGGPEIEPGKDYVLFLNNEDLPGATQVRTVRDLCQGIFDVVQAPDGPRAVSQATRHPLLADDKGVFEAPGGQEGLSLDQMVLEIRNLTGRR